MKKNEEESLNALFKETLNQFNYSSRLYDNIDQKINTHLFFVSIILMVSLNNYFLNKLADINFYAQLIFWVGISLVILSIIKLFRLRSTKFRLIMLRDLKELFIKDKDKDIRKVVISKYVPIIEENFKHYQKKDSRFIKTSIISKIGGLILLSAIIYILVCP